MTNLDITIILYVLSLAMAFYCGMRYAEYKLISKMIDMMTPEERDELEDLAHKIKADLEKKGIKGVQVHSVDEEDVVTVHHEIMDGVHFLYRDGTKFVCQGPTFEGVANTFAATISKREVGVIKHHDGGTSLIIENKLKGGGEVTQA
jgi:hypothetical protein